MTHTLQQLSSLPQTRPFGYTYILDLYGCKAGTIADDCREFLDQLARRLKVKVRKIDGYSEKDGHVAWLEFNGGDVQLRVHESSRQVAIDVFATTRFPKAYVVMLATEAFQFSMYHEHYIERGAINEARRVDSERARVGSVSTRRRRPATR